MFAMNELRLERKRRNGSLGVILLWTCSLSILVVVAATSLYIAMPPLHENCLWTSSLSVLVPMVNVLQKGKLLYLTSFATILIGFP